MRLLSAALGVLAAAAIAGCGGSTGSTATHTVTRTVSGGSGGSGGSSTSPPPTTTTTTRSTPATTSSTTTAAGGGTPPCTAAHLVLSYLGGQGATGHGLLGFALRNTGSGSCRTVGYPGVQFLDGSGGPLPTKPTHTTDDFFGHAPYRPLVVGAGASVSFRLGVSHGQASNAGCTTVHGLQVIPPNDTATLRVTIPRASECGGAVTVSPLQPGHSAFH
jgi:hypothetical protein